MPRTTQYLYELAQGVGAGSRSGILACDTFQRADSSTLGAVNNLPYLPGRPGPTWSEVAGNWEINGNRIGSQGSSPGGQGWIVTLDIGASDYEISWTLAYTTDGTANAILLAYVDGTNFLRLAHNSSTIGWTRTTSGSGTSVGSGSSGVSPALGDTIVVSKVAAAYTARVIRAGAQVGTTAIINSETQGQSSTVIGLRAGPASVRWTNFVARSAA